MAAEPPHEIWHLRLHRRARRDAAEDLRGSARLAEGGRGCRLLRLSPHRAPRDALVDDAVAERVSGRRRARNAAHPSRHAALSPAALPPAAAVGRAVHARSSHRRPPRHRRGARHLAHGVRRLWRRFRASRRRLRARLEYSLQGFTQERIDYRCDRFTFKDVPVVIRPLQRPHPPLWYGLRGDQGPVFAARHGMHGVTLGPDEKVANMLATFRAHWRTYAADRARRQSPVERPHCGVMRAIFVADSDAEAERVARPAYKRWFDSLAWLWVERGSFPPISI